MAGGVMASGSRNPPARKGSARAFILICLAALLLLAAVWERVKAGALLSEIDAVRARRARLASEVDYLEMQRGRKLSLREVEPLATRRLGLGTATVGQVVRLTWDDLSRPALAFRRAEGATAGAFLPAVRTRGAAAAPLPRRAP